MLVQVKPSSEDLGETLCSLNFATRVGGVEHGPARKQTDVSELLKYKQLAENAKHDEKEAKKLQDSVQPLQLRLSVAELSKEKDLENQLAEERKTRLKQESSCFCAAISLVICKASTENYRVKTTIGTFKIEATTEKNH